jgi:hypothetical protein
MYDPNDPFADLRQNKAKEVPEEKEMQVSPFADLRSEKKLEYTKEDFLRDPRTLIAAAVKNSPESAWSLLKSLGAIAQNPMGAAANAGKMVQQTANKLGRKAAEFEYSRTHPRQDFEVMPGREETLPDLAGQELKNRYGGVDQILNTIATDPVGAAFDVGGVGGMIAKPLKAIEPLANAGKVVQKAAGGSGGTLPERAYMQAAGIPLSAGDEGVRLANRAMNERIPVSYKGMSELQKLKSEAGITIDKIIQDGAARNVRIPKSNITNYLDAMIKDDRYKITLPELRQLHKMRQDFARQFRFKTTLSAKEMQDWKTNAYERAYKGEASLAPDKTTSITAKADREMARGAKESLELRFPELKDANNNWADYAKLKSYVDAKVDATKASDELFGTMMQMTIRNPWVQKNMGRMLKAVRDGDLGWLEKNLNSNEIRTALVLGGRNQEMVDEYGVEDRPVERK